MQHSSITYPVDFLCLRLRHASRKARPRMLSGQRHLRGGHGAVENGQCFYAHALTCTRCRDACMSRLIYVVQSVVGLTLKAAVERDEKATKQPVPTQNRSIQC
jgi:hypothetical protein